MLFAPDGALLPNDGDEVAGTCGARNRDEVSKIDWHVAFGGLKGMHIPRRSQGEQSELLYPCVKAVEPSTLFEKGASGPSIICVVGPLKPSMRGGAGTQSRFCARRGVGLYDDYAEIHRGTKRGSTAYVDKRVCPSNGGFRLPMLERSLRVVLDEGLCGSLATTDMTLHIYRRDA